MICDLFAVSHQDLHDEMINEADKKLPLTRSMEAVKIGNFQT